MYEIMQVHILRNIVLSYSSIPPGLIMHSNIGYCPSHLKMKPVKLPLKLEKKIVHGHGTLWYQQIKLIHLNDIGWLGHSNNNNYYDSLFPISSGSLRHVGRQFSIHYSLSLASSPGSPIFSTFQKLGIGPGNNATLSLYVLEHE